MNDICVKNFVASEHLDAARRIENYLETSGALLGTECSLAAGLAGIALFYQNLLRHDDRADYRAKLNRLVDRIFTIVERTPGVDFRFYPGLTGVGFALERIALDEPNNASADGDVNDELDSALYHHLTGPKWTGHYDLINGLVGAGVYALSRTDTDVRDRLFKASFDQLGRWAESSAEGICWRTPPEFVGKESTRAQFPNGNYNLGVAHGNPGVVALLADALAAGVQRSRLRETLEGATAWLMRQAVPGAEGFYGYTVGDQRKARSAWCYGDPGNAVALVRSGRALNDSTVFDFGIECGLNAARRPVSLSGVNDHGLCHGSAGLGLIFMTLFRESKNAEFLVAADAWFKKTLSAAQSKDLSELKTNVGDGTWQLQPGTLTGVSGIGLALLDRLDAIPSGWSKWLLI